MKGEVIEVIIYNRVLSDSEVRAVEEYLARKYTHTSTIWVWIVGIALLLLMAYVLAKWKGAVKKSRAGGNEADPKERR